MESPSEGCGWPGVATTSAVNQPYRFAQLPTPFFHMPHSVGPGELVWLGTQHNSTDCISTKAGAFGVPGGLSDVGWIDYRLTPSYGRISSGTVSLVSGYLFTLDRLLKS